VRRTAAALILAGLAATGQAAESRSGSASATLTVSATVVARAVMSTEYQVPELVITPVDVARGYVDVARATRLTVRTNSANGYLLAFESSQPLFTDVQVSGAGEPASITGGNGWVLQPFAGTTVAMDLSYRFHLAPGVAPGSYPWPIGVSVRTP
jgi:hypothetical protein